MLELLFESPAATAHQRQSLPAAIRHRHGSEFALLPGTGLYSNFVGTLDGVVELGDPKVSSGSAISERNEDDRFLMGLLRSFAEYILVGAGTFNSEPLHAWTAEAIFPSLAEEFGLVRRERGLAPQPTLLVATRSGVVNRGHAAFDQQAVRLIEGVTALPAGVILTEGGPRLMGSLAGRVDEVFVTLAPAVAGRAGQGRPGMVEGFEFPASDLLRHRLLTVHRSGSLLFTRYQRVGAL